MTETSLSFCLIKILFDTTHFVPILIFNDNLFGLNQRSEFNVIKFTTLHTIIVNRNVYIVIVKRRKKSLY